MFTLEQHLDNLVRHINLVRDACLLLGKKLIAQERPDLGRLLIANGFIHDASKFTGIEWDYLHAGTDTDKESLVLAIKQHVTTNPHHPEYWGGFEYMPEIYIAEMACDFYARSQEFGSCLIDWIKNDGEEKYRFSRYGTKYKQLRGFINLLTENHLVK